MTTPAPIRRYRVPGRVELVGKHVDYGGGRSLTCAVEFAVTASGSPIAERILRVRQRGSRDAVELPLDGTAQPTRVRWSTYAAAVARRVARDFPQLRNGADVRLSSSLPPSAGLSSSTALTVAITRALVDATGLSDDPAFQEHLATPIAFAEYVAAIETGSAFGPWPGDAGVGVRGGAQDHVAVCCSRAGMVGQFSYIPARELGFTPWPTDYQLAIAVSGVRASKTGNAQAAYNRAADAVRWLVREWRGMTYRDDATLAAALASASDAGDRLHAIAANATGAPVPAEYLTRRLAQFREECDVIVPGVAAALAARDFAKLGQLVDRSQRLAESALENQVPETIALQQRARALGAVAASAFGAGFGGAVWAMVRGAEATHFIAEWEARYRTDFPQMPRRVARGAKFLLTRPSAATF